MVRITIIVMTMIFTKLMTNPLRVRETTKGTKQGCILELLWQSVNEVKESNRISGQAPASLDGPGFLDSAAFYPLVNHR